MSRSSRRSLVFALPFWLLVLVFYAAPTVWTVALSFTSSRSLPGFDFVGFAQYRRLWASERWIESLGHLGIFGMLSVGAAVGLGLLLAILIDQKVRGENALRVAFLFPCASSFIVTGLIWQWLMNPALGIQHTVRDWGWTGFTFDWASRPETALLAVTVAGIWQSAGMVMAILLASLRRIDGQIWQAARIDGIPAHKVYRSIIVPQLGPTLASVAVLQLVGVVKVYDLIVALTQGGPGTASDMPTLYVMDYLFVRQNVGLASAASVVMLMTVCAVAAPVYYARSVRGARARS